MTDTRDFERQLRAEFARAADRVQASPGAAERAIAHAVHTPPRPSRTRGWTVPLIAAAVVLLVVSATVLLAAKVHRPGRPATPPASSAPLTPTPTVTSTAPPPTPTTTPAPLTVIDGIHPITCRTTNADTVMRQLRNVQAMTALGTPDLSGLPILSVTPTGDVLTGPQSYGKLDLVSSSGGISVLYTAPGVSDPTARVSWAQADSRWVAFAESVGQGQSSIVSLAVIDRASGTATVFRRYAAIGSTMALPPVLYDGAVYWTERTSTTGAVLRYDPATGQTSTLATGTNLSPVVMTGGGLYWQAGTTLVTYRGGQLPPGFALTGGKLTAPVTDGTTSVWVAPLTADSPLTLELSRPGMTRPVPIVQEPASAGLLVPLAVAGPYVLWQDNTGIVALDTRTGAATVLLPPNVTFANAAANGPTLALNEIGSKGGAALLLGHIDTLPRLHC